MPCVVGKKSNMLLSPNVAVRKNSPLSEINSTPFFPTSWVQPSVYSPNIAPVLLNNWLDSVYICKTFSVYFDRQSTEVMISIFSVIISQEKSFWKIISPTSKNLTAERISVQEKNPFQLKLTLPNFPAFPRITSLSLLPLMFLSVDWVLMYLRFLNKMKGVSSLCWAEHTNFVSFL